MEATRVCMLHGRTGLDAPVVVVVVVVLVIRSWTINGVVSNGISFMSLFC